VQLTRKRIIAAAMDLIERDGAEAVSMRRLAIELRCGLVSLYQYVPSKSALLDGIAEALTSGIEVPSVVGAGGWQEQFRAQARAFHATVMTRPRCAMVVVSRPPTSAGVLRPVERALATLGAAGFGRQDAVWIVRAVAAFIMGSVLAQVAVAPGLADIDDETHRLRLRPGEFPHLTALAAECAASSNPAASNREAAFEFGLDLLIRAVSAMQPTHAVAG
jgi:AcrR family transcriptional regulator